MGNGASKQLQLDIYGELIDSIDLFDKHATPISYDLWTQLRRLVNDRPQVLELHVVLAIEPVELPAPRAAIVIGPRDPRPLLRAAERGVDPLVVGVALEVLELDHRQR